jgi:hypothetical protein
VRRNGFVYASTGLGATALVVVLATAGLAVAGVNLPDPAKQAFERVGVSLPNQAGGGEHARSDEVKAVIDATAPSDRGCEFGHNVAEAAKGSPLPAQAQAACSHSSERKHAARNKHGRASDGVSSSVGRDFGKATSERAKALKDATVDERRQFGKDTAERAKELGSGHASPPAAKSPAGPPADTPNGPPADTPNGPPADTPNGPPEGTPRGH